MKKTIKSILSSNKLALIIILVAIVALFSILSDVFLTSKNMLNVFRQISMIGIAAAGMICVLLTGGIDLSVGRIVSLVNILCAYLMVNMGVNWGAACLISLFAATIVGLINGFLISYCKMLPFFTTLCTMYVLQGVSYLMCNGIPIYGFDEGFSFLGQGYVGRIPFPVVLMIFILAVAWFVLEKTYFGRHLYAMGGNEEAAALSGVRIRPIKMLVYGINGFFAGLAGIVWLSRLNSGQPVTGNGFEFDVISAIVLGGVSVSGGEGDIPGALLGVLIIGLLNNGLVIVGTSEYVQLIIKGFVLLFAVLLDSLKKAHKK